MIQSLIGAGIFGLAVGVMAACADWKQGTGWARTVAVTAGIIWALIALAALGPHGH